MIQFHRHRYLPAPEKAIGAMSFFFFFFFFCCLLAQLRIADRPAVGRKGRADERQRRVELLEQRFGHRPDIAFRRRIEGRAVFEDDLLGAVGDQPAAGGQRLRRPPRSAAIERVFSATTAASMPGSSAAPSGIADILDGAGAGLGKRVGDVARTGEIVADDADLHSWLVARRAGARTSSAAARDGRASPLRRGRDRARRCPRRSPRCAS